MVSPSVTLAGLACIAVGPYVAFHLYGRRVMALEVPTVEKVHRLRRASAIGLTVLAVVVAALVVGLDLIAQLEGALAAVAPGLVDRSTVTFVLVLAAIFGPMVLAYVSAALALHPYDRELRDTEVAAATAVRKTVLGLVAVLVPVVAWLGLLEALPDAWLESEIVLVAVFGVFILTVYAVAPYLAIVFGDTHRLTGAKRDEVETFCRDLGVAPRDVRVIETDGDDVANAMVAGTLPGVTYVFLTEHLLESFPDRELEAILAHEVGHVVGRHLWVRAAVAFLAVGIWMVAIDRIGLGPLEEYFGFLGVFLPIVGVFLGYYLLVHGTLAVRQEFAADRFAAERTSVEATIGALEALAETNHAKRDVGRLYELLTVHPSIDDRVARLREDG